MRRVCLALIVCLSAAPVLAEEDLAVKAKFLYQITRYVSWPAAAHPAPDSPIVIGVLDDPPLAEALVAVTGSKKIKGRHIEIVSLSESDGADVHLLFVPEAGRGALRRLARAYQDGTVLTVAEEFDFPELGGDVGIELVRDRISFSINRRKATRGDFQISSKLMRLASEVK